MSALRLEPDRGKKSEPRDPRHRKRVMVRFGLEALEKIAFTSNLSEHGLLLHTNSVHPPGTLLQVEVDPPGYPKFALVGRVVWVKKVPPRLQQVKSSTMGLSFKEPSRDWIEFCEHWNA
jgi:hypothetical protein